MAADIDRYAEQWETNAQIDAHFSVLTDPDKLHGRWDRDAFYASGENEIARLFAWMDAHDISVSRGACLDFGCGVGRLTRALAGRFETALGVDISPTMVELARTAVPEAEFRVNRSDDLAFLAEGSLEFVHTNIVLQHMNNDLQRAFLAEFCRVLSPGGLAAVQCPSADLPMIGGRLRAMLPEPVVKAAKRLLGRRSAPRKKWKRRIKMEMNCLPETEVARVVSDAGCEIERLVYTNATEADFGGRLAFYDERAARQRIYWRRAKLPSPYLSALYFIRKPGPTSP